jgi:hypothetical protein
MAATLSFGDPDGTPELFVKDALVYGGTAGFPGFGATGSADVRTRFGSIPAVSHEVFPASGDLPR